MPRFAGLLSLGALGLVSLLSLGVGGVAIVQGYAVRAAAEKSPAKSLGEGARQQRGAKPGSVPLPSGSTSPRGLTPLPR